MNTNEKTEQTDRRTYKPETKARFQELKRWLKDTGKTIRETRIQYKNAQREHKGYNTLLRTLKRLTWEYRHKHIAYSELRGRTRDQIEQPNDDNYPNELMIEKIKLEIMAPEQENQDA